MNLDFNTQSIQRIYNIAIFAQDITLQRIEQAIAEVQKQNPMLVELYSENFFREIKQQLEVKKSLYNIYITGVKRMQEHLDKQLDVADGRVSSIETEYKNLLNAAENAFSVLITKIDIKITEIENRQKEKDHEEDY